MASAAAFDRHALGDTTNSPPPSPPSTIKASGTSLSRKKTFHDLHRKLDSSEDYPSLHSSLYDASVQDEGPKDDASETPWARTDDIVNGADGHSILAWENIVLGPDGSHVPMSYLRRPSTSGKLHVPTNLTPISEQNSLLTLRSRLSSLTTRSRSRSPGLAVAHKKSFSLSDLPSHTEAQHSSESSALDIRPPPQPKRPTSQPPRRSPTPPNLPSFGQPEAIKYRLPPPSKRRFRDRLGTPTAEELEWRRQTVGLPKGVVMRGEDGVLVRGKFQPIRSGHLPPQRQQHNTMALPTHERNATPGPPAAPRAPANPVEQRPSRSNSQVEEARRISAEVSENIAQEKREKKARRKATCLKILLICDPFGLCRCWRKDEVAGGSPPLTPLTADFNLGEELLETRSNGGTQSPQLHALPATSDLREIGESPRKRKKRLSLTNAQASERSYYDEAEASTENDLNAGEGSSSQAPRPEWMGLDESRSLHERDPLSRHDTA